MDKETLSNYGWIVICTLVLAVMIALATPFGEYISAGVWSTTNGLNDTLNKNLEIAGLSSSDDNGGDNGDTPYDPDNVYTFTPTEMGLIDRNFNAKPFHEYTLTINYENGTIKTQPIITFIYFDLVVFFTYIDQENQFILYDNCTYDTDIDDIVYAENKSIYLLYNADNTPEPITSITIDFNNAVDYSNREGAIFADGFLTWDELKNEYNVTDTSIGYSAFEYETDLLAINLPEGVTEIGGSAFQYCSMLCSVSLPDGLKTIGDYAFDECNSLTSLTLPETVTNIGEFAFYCCYGLSQINIPNGVTVINDHTFASCGSLTSLTLPDGITSIKPDAFRQCHDLADINIPDGVTSIGDSAFAYCSELKTITLPSSVTTIEGYAFYYCDSLETINFDGTVEQWNNIDKASYWCQYANSLENIVCSDGIIAA